MASQRPARRRTRQIVRVLGILKTLLEGKRPTIYELAEEFGVRREAIYRDLHTLEDIGYPIEEDPERGLVRPGLDPGLVRQVPGVRFTAREAAALTWAIERI